MYRLKREAFEFMLGVSRSLYPREFIGLLRAEENTITEVIVLPLSTYGEGFSSYFEHMMPIDHSIVGSVHSHPGRSATPSRGDLHAFGKKGGVNIIIKYPYQSMDDLVAYDNQGVEVKLELL